MAEMQVDMKAGIVLHTVEHTTPHEFRSVLGIDRHREMKFIGVVMHESSMFTGPERHDTRKFSGMVQAFITALQQAENTPDSPRLVIMELHRFMSQLTTAVTTLAQRPAGAVIAEKHAPALAVRISIRNAAALVMSDTQALNTTGMMEPEHSDMTIFRHAEKTELMHVVMMDAQMTNGMTKREAIAPRIVPKVEPPNTLKTMEMQPFMKLMPIASTAPSRPPLIPTVFMIVLMQPSMPPPRALAPAAPKSMTGFCALAV